MSGAESVVEDLIREAHEKRAAVLDRGLFCVGFLPLFVVATGVS